MNKKPLKLIVIGAAVIGGLLLAKNLIARSVVIAGVKAVTGLTLDVGSMDVGVFRSALGVKNLRLRNPAGFTDPYMVDLPEFYVDYDLGAFLKHRVHLESLRLHLKEFTVVREQGKLNLDALKVVQASKTGSPKPAAPPPGKSPEIQVDRLELKVGSVVFKDYPAGGAPRVQTFDVNVDEQYEHITNPQALAALIVTRTLMRTSIAKLTGLDLNALQSQLTGQIQRAAQAATAVAGQVGSQATAAAGSAKSAAQGAVNAGKEAAGEVTGTVKKTTDALKKAFGQ